MNWIKWGYLIVYWYMTDSNGTGVYYHFGTAYSVDKSNPNMS